MDDFDTDPAKQNVMRSIVAGAALRDVVIIAEGVETEDQRMVLAGPGVQQS